MNPPVHGIDVEHVEDASDPSKGILAIYVPPSIGGPHRAKMGGADVEERYYQRSGSRSDIMPHSTLGALFGRIAAPNLWLRMPITVQRASDGRGWDVHYSLELLNTGRGTARRPVICFFEVEQRNLTFWSEALNTGSQPRGWTRIVTTGFSENVQVQLSAPDSEVIVYPNYRLPLITNGTLFQGLNFQSPIAVATNIAIYSIDAQPVEHSGTLRAVVDGGTQVVEFPPREERP